MWVIYTKNISRLLISTNLFKVSPASTSPRYPPVFSTQYHAEEHQNHEQSSSHHNLYPSNPQHTQHRQQHPFFKPSMSSLKAPTAPYRRPPPDSPVDVSALSSSSHEYDDDNRDDDDDYEDVEEDDDAELMESFATAFGSGNVVATHVTKYGVFAAAPGRRGTQTQSLLPFPVSRKGSLSRGGASSPTQGAHRLEGQVSRGSLVHLGPGQVQRSDMYNQGLNMSSSQSSPVYSSDPSMNTKQFQGDLNSRRPTSLPTSSAS